MNDSITRAHVIPVQRNTSPQLDWEATAGKAKYTLVELERGKKVLLTPTVVLNRLADLSWHVILCLPGKNGEVYAVSPDLFQAKVVGEALYRHLFT